jgi:hypothetical protein
MKNLNFQTHISLKRPPLYFLFYFFEIPEIFPYKTTDLEYVNFATPYIQDVLEFDWQTFRADSMITNKYKTCDQKLASDSSGLPGGFSGQRAWVRIFKKMGARQLLSWAGCCLSSCRDKCSDLTRRR